jgi:predicted ATPase
MTLEPLSRSATPTLLSDLLTRSDPGVSTCRSMAVPTGEKLTSLCTSLVDQIGGNPLFAMEYVRLVQDRGSRGGVVPAGKLLPVPQLVHNIIATRIDTLTPVEKSVLYDAALFGAQFCPKLLADIGDRHLTDVEEYLEALERHDLLRQCGIGSDLSHFEYVFNHAMVREVTYSRLPHAVRADKPSLAAEWIRAQPRNQADLLVHHYRQSVHHATLAGRSPQDLMDKACEGLIQAGHPALSRGGRRAALHCYRSALEFCPPQHPQRALLLRWYKQELEDESAS